MPPSPPGSPELHTDLSKADIRGVAPKPEQEPLSEPETQQEAEAEADVMEPEPDSVEDSAGSAELPEQIRLDVQRMAAMVKKYGGSGSNYEAMIKQKQVGVVSAHGKTPT